MRALGHVQRLVLPGRHQRRPGVVRHVVLAHGGQPGAEGGGTVLAVQAEGQGEATDREAMHIPGATDVYTGVSEADFSGYPDCRAAFIRSHQKMMRLALDWPIKIVTPFIHMSKADEWALADRLGILDVIENETLTCYNGIPGDGCGTCPACKLRNRGYKEFLRAKAAKNGRTVGI